MDGMEEQNLRDSPTPDKEEYQNQSHIMRENIQDQDQLWGQAENLTAFQDLMAGFDAISWLDGEDFIFSEEAITSSTDFGCLSSPSFSLPHSCAMHPQNKALTNPTANSYPSFAFSSSFPSSTWATLQASSCVPRSLPQCSSKMSVQSLVSNPIPIADMQLGVNSSEQFPGDVLMVDELGERTIQPSKYDLSCAGFGKMNNNGVIEGEKKESNDDVAKFILEWLEKNKDVISPEDLRSIRLKKSTIACAERRLGPGPRGRMQLVQLILAWVQNHHLKKKRRRLQEPDKSDVILWGNPLPLSNQDCSTYSGFVTGQLFKNELQPTQYSAAPIDPLYYQEQNMTSMSLAAREAQEKRMVRKRKMVLLKQSRALGQSGTTVQHGSVEEGKDDTGNWTFWSSLAMNSQRGMGLMEPSLLSGGSSSSSQIMQTMYRSSQHVSSVLWSGNSATVRRQDLRFHDRNLKFLLQKVLKRSDVGTLKRIVLPKKEAEIHLPELDTKDGIVIPMTEIRTSRVWDMRYRYWPNNNSRMYVLENTGEFICSNGLEEGDCIMIFSDLESGKYMIKAAKARKLQGSRGRF